MRNDGGEVFGVSEVVGMRNDGRKSLGIEKKVMPRQQSKMPTAPKLNGATFAGESVGTRKSGAVYVSDQLEIHSGGGWIMGNGKDLLQKGERWW
ncbi:hypothetical protein Tco_0121014 [Tanacetum coccineum]